MSVTTRSTYRGPEMPSTSREEFQWYWDNEARLKSRPVEADKFSSEDQRVWRELELREALSAAVVHSDTVGQATVFAGIYFPMPAIDRSVLGDRFAWAHVYQFTASGAVHLVIEITEADGYKTLQRYELDEVTGLWSRYGPLAKMRGQEYTNVGWTL
jgi:hypothetical protein